MKVKCLYNNAKSLPDKLKEKGNEALETDLIINKKYHVYGVNLYAKK